MSPARSKARLTFFIALALLSCSAFAAVWFVAGLLSNERSLRHTYVVEVALGRLDAAVVEASRLRTVFFETGDATDLRRLRALHNEVQRLLTDVRELTANDAVERPLYLRLESLTRERLELNDRWIDLQEQGQRDFSEMSSQAAKLSFAAVDIREQMRRIEDDLLVQRTKASENLAAGALATLFALVCFSILLLWVHHRWLSEELHNREQAELAAQHLSARVLQIKDEERRWIARELHDSVGQNLAAAKLMAEGSLRKDPGNEAQIETIGLLAQCIRETRTLSHLLHPPLLDEIGLASAAVSFVNGFAERTGVAMTANIPEIVPRLPHRLELVLFRAIQEALTNIHRHSGSAKGEVSLSRRGNLLVLLVRDYGKGIAAETLREFHSAGTHVGVGLAGMRGRVREQGGALEIFSDAAGTLIQITIPFDPQAQVPASDFHEFGNVTDVFEAKVEIHTP